MAKEDDTPKKAPKEATDESRKHEKSTVSSIKKLQIALAILAVLSLIELIWLIALTVHMAHHTSFGPMRPGLRGGDHYMMW